MVIKGILHETALYFVILNVSRGGLGFSSHAGDHILHFLIVDGILNGDSALLGQGGYKLYLPRLKGPGSFGEQSENV